MRNPETTLDSLSATVRKLYLKRQEAEELRYDEPDTLDLDDSEFFEHLNSLDDEFDHACRELALYVAIDMEFA